MGKEQAVEDEHSDNEFGVKLNPIQKERLVPHKFQYITDKYEKEILVTKNQSVN